MLEKALSGSKAYWAWLLFLGAIIGIAFLAYLRQYFGGLYTTGLSRDVPWGFYIAQFTFLVGVAASAVMVVIPYYLHDFKKFAKLAVLGEFIAVAAVVMCLTFIIVDMGRPDRAINMVLHPSPNSLMFWDFIVCFGYLTLNVTISIVTFGAERKGVHSPAWIKPLVYLSIPWAISIHTVTAFLYSGLAGRAFWLTAILAPRFLASAFAAGPSLLILICLIIRRVADYDVGQEAIKKLGIIVTYAMSANVFFILMEVFTSIYSQMPHHVHHFQYLFMGLTDPVTGERAATLVPWMWTSVMLAVVSLFLLYIPKLRNNPSVLAAACVAVFGSLWIDKGLGMVVTGFIPGPAGRTTEYWPTMNEAMISLGIWALGFLVLTALYKIAITVRKSAEA